MESWSRSSSLAAGTCPLAAAAPPDPLVLRLHNLGFIPYFSSLLHLKHILHQSHGAEPSPLHPLCCTGQPRRGRVLVY